MSVYYEFGTIEGHLQVVQSHGKNFFFVREVLTGHLVRCFATPKQKKQAKTLLQKRVAVSGRITYRGSIPFVIRVEKLRRLRDQHEVPQPDDMEAIDITGGLSSEDHVRGRERP